MGLNRDIEKFIERAALVDFEVHPIPGDASERKYYRLLKADKSLILMDSSLMKDSMKDFLYVSEYLAQHNYSVPNILDIDLNTGFMLLEDLGQKTIGEYLSEDPYSTPIVYNTVVELLVNLSRLRSPNLPKFDREFFLVELTSFLDDYLPMVSKNINDDERKQFTSSWGKVLEYLEINDPADCFVHKDLHSGNLFWIPTREKFQRIGIIDFQNAKNGSNSYDITSLLYDCRFPLDPSLREALLEKYQSTLDIPKDRFRTVCNIFIAQRNIKILGNFAKIYGKGGNKRYLKYLPNVWSNIYSVMHDPVLEDVMKWITEHTITSKSNFV